MAVDATVPRSRRALLAATLGSIAVLGSRALGQPPPARAADGDPFLVGQSNAASGVTALASSGSGLPLTAQAAGAAGVIGIASATTGLSQGVVGRTASPDGRAVFGWAQALTGPGEGVSSASDSSDGIGVRGNNSSVGPGVLGTSHQGHGVRGTSSNGIGVVGTGPNGARGEAMGAGSGVTGVSPAGTGVAGWSSGPDAFGVSGTSDASSAGTGVFGTTLAATGETTGVRGRVQSPDGFGVLGDTQATEASARAMVGHAPGGTGVLGWAGTGPHPGGVAETGVYGYSATDTASVGVRGESPAGTGVLAVSATGNALRVSGKARFNRSGRVSVPKSRNYVDVTVPGGIASNTVVNATIQMYRAGVAVAGVRLNYPSAGKARIYLTKVASTTSSTPVAWIATEYGS